MRTQTLTKLCSRCYEIKPISAFSKDKKNNDGLRYHCKDCGKIYRNMHPRIPAATYRANLKYRYGITPEDYNAFFKKQKGCCAICKRHQSEFKKNLAVDHNHKTSVVRGLLCPNCNLLLGLVKESRGVLIKAIQYLQR